MLFTRKQNTFMLINENCWVDSDAISSLWSIRKYYWGDYNVVGLSYDSAFCGSELCCAMNGIIIINNMLFISQYNEATSQITSQQESAVYRLNARLRC